MNQQGNEATKGGGGEQKVPKVGNKLLKSRIKTQYVA
jgi:hypothetical protein